MANSLLPLLSRINKQTPFRFQWASLQITQLLELDRESDMRLRLGKLLDGLNKAYDEMYEKIRANRGSAPEIAERAFQWVMYSYHPLSPAQLVAAACQDPETEGINAVDIGIDFVLAACSNLLVVDPQLQVCQFSHLSVQEYLESSRLKAVQADSLIARVCLRLLNDASPDGYEKLLQDYQASEQDPEDNAESELVELLEYVTLYWHAHVRRCEEAGEDQQLSCC